MRVVFFGTPPFAASVLKSLIKRSVNVVGVISRPDKPSGRNRQLHPVPVKVVAEEAKIPVYQPEKVSDPSFEPVLKGFDADLFVVVAYGEILKQHVLDIPKMGCINLHASLLPKYRGAAPIQRAIIAGEAKSGVTLMHMVRKMDAGAMISKAEVEIDPLMTYGELESALCEKGSELLLKLLEECAGSLPEGEAQEESEVTFAPKIELEECRIDWTKGALELHNLVRGVNPEPGAWSEIQVDGGRRRLRIFRTLPREELRGELRAACLTADKKVCVGCGRGSLELLEVQPEGKKRMTAYDFIRGIQGKSFHFAE